MRFEIAELGNTDIIDYMQENYGLLSEYPCDMDNEEFSYTCIENVSYIVEEIMKYIRDYFHGSDDIMGIWLTTYDNVISRYRGCEHDIDSYVLPEDYLIISDLGCDGSLFVFRN